MLALLLALVGADRVPLVVLGLLALPLGSLRRIPGRWLGLAGVCLSTGAFFLRYGAHRFSSLPLVDWVRPLTIDRSALLPMLGMLLLLGTVRGALTEGAWLRPVWRGLCLLGCGLLFAYWFTPKHFNADQVLPAEGPGFQFPVARGGELAYGHWSRQVFRGTPVLLLPWMVANEHTLADLAHGMQLQTARDTLECGGVTSARATRQERVRGILWSVQKAHTTVVFILQGALLVLALGVLVLALSGLPAGSLVLGVVLGDLWLLLLSIPLLNLTLLAAGRLAGLPDGRDELGRGVLLALGFLALVLVMETSGRVLGTRGSDHVGV